MRAGLWLGLIVLLVVAEFAAGQQPAGGATGSGGSTTLPPSAKIPDYFGPAGNQPFGEKALFPSSPNSGTPALQPIPGEPPPTLIPDGSLPPPPPPRRWFGGFEFGASGSQGNSDVFSGRLGANIDRKTDDNLFHVDLLYTLSRQDGTTNQNQALLNARDEVLFKGTPWSLFSATQVEYDQFRAYDFRVGTYAGVAYAWVKTGGMLFKTRVGFGAVRELDTVSNGSPARWVPEAVLGMDFNYRFTERQGWVSSVDVYPNLSQLGQYRVRARAGYEILIDPDHGMVLRLGVQDRYDTLPGPAKRNDLNYFITLLFKF